MAASRVAGGTTTESTLVLPHSFTIGTVLDNDWLLACMPYASGARNVSQTAGPTLTEVGAPGVAQSGATLRVYKRKLAAADSGSTFTLTNDVSGLKSSISWIILRGFHGTDIIGDFTSAALGSAFSHTPPAISAAATYGVPLVMMADFRGATTPNTSAWTVPAGYTESSENYSGGTTGLVSSVLAYKDSFAAVASGSNVAPGAFTADHAAFANAYTLILKLPNVPPVVSAGVNQSVAVSTLVTLSGEDSDEDGTISSRLWTAVSYPGSAPSITNGTTATATFTPAVAGTYVFEYSATDNSGDTSVSQVTIYVATVTPRPASVISAGTWTNVGAAANIAAALADESDTTYAESVANPAGAAFTVRMDPWATGQESWNSTKLSKSDNTTNIDMLIELLCGAVVVDSVTISLTTTATASTARVLDSTQRALITDRNNMRLRYTATTV